MFSRRKNKNDIEYDNSTSLASLISARQKAFDVTGLVTVLCKRRSSWFVSMSQRSQSEMCDSRSSVPTETNVGKMQIPDTLSPKFPCLLLDFFLINFL